MLQRISPVQLYSWSYRRSGLMNISIGHIAWFSQVGSLLVLLWRILYTLCQGILFLCLNWSSFLHSVSHNGTHENTDRFYFLNDSGCVSFSIWWENNLREERYFWYIFRDFRPWLSAWMAWGPGPGQTIRVKDMAEPQHSESGRQTDGEGLATS